MKSDIVPIWTFYLHIYQKRVKKTRKTIKGTFYPCKGRGHRSNVCPTMRVTVVAEERDEEEENGGSAIENDEYAEVEFLEEEYDVRVNFVLLRIYYHPKMKGNTRICSKHIFQSITKCVI